MWQLPPLPPWDAVHPMIVHFPIVLLLVAPLFILLGIMRDHWGRVFSVSALILLVLGAISAVVVAEAGGAAAALVVRTESINVVLHAHAELADTTETLAIVFAAIYLILVALRLVLRERLKPGLWGLLTIVFLVGYGSVLLALVNTAHDGGRLVHEFGVHANLPPEPLPTVVAGQDDD